ncbi:MAG: sigma-70 family RNA polymerase sigma factor [Actinomycetota bacterium]
MLDQRGHIVTVTALVKAAADGDTAAWDELVEKYARLIWAIARSHGLSVADADDVMQTTWLRLAEHLVKLRDPERIGAWLAVTARNESLRLARRARRDVPFDPMVDIRRPSEGGEVDRALLTEERDQALWQAFQSLPYNCRVLLLMLTTEPGFSYEQIGESLGVPIGSIGPTRGRCLDKLRAEPVLKRYLEDRAGSMRGASS